MDRSGLRPFRSAPGEHKGSTGHPRRASYKENNVRQTQKACSQSPRAVIPTIAFVLMVAMEARRAASECTCSAPRSRRVSQGRPALQASDTGR